MSQLLWPRSCRDANEKIWASGLTLFSGSGSRVRCTVSCRSGPGSRRDASLVLRRYGSVIFDGVSTNELLIGASTRSHLTSEGTIDRGDLSALWASPPQLVQTRTHIHVVYMILRFSLSRLIFLENSCYRNFKILHAWNLIFIIFLNY